MVNMPIECVICGTNKNSSLMISIDTCEDCSNSFRQCKQCFSSSIASRWKDGACPECARESVPPVHDRFSASATSVALDSKSDSKKVVVTDIQMPFESMVIFMIKWAFASIPAAIILGVVWMLLIGLAS